MTPPISAAAIVAACRHAAAATVVIDVVDATGSTNADLLARAGTGAGAAPAPAALTGPTLLVARRQTAGRGRAGRTWMADAGSLTFSLAWRFDQPVAALVGLPLAIGVAVAEVLNAKAAGAQLKWPNDVLVNGAKLAGVLIETVALPTLLQPQTWAVIGVGINMRDDTLVAAPVGLQAALPITDTAVATLPATDRNLLLAQLLDAFCAALGTFDASALTPFVARWNALHAHAGQMVNILERGVVRHRGRALGIDAVGRLLLQTGSGTVAVMAGDVSLRLAGEGVDAVVD